MVDCSPDLISQKTLLCLYVCAEIGVNSTEITFSYYHVCAQWAHMVPLWHALLFLQIFIYHIDPMCAPFTLHVLLVQSWKNSLRENALKDSTLPWRVVPVILCLDLGIGRILHS